MKLVPFILRCQQAGFQKVTEMRLFLSYAGRGVWKTEEPGLLSKKEIVEEYCEPNGFVVKDIKLDTKAKIAYIHVDEKKTNMKDFYTWQEALEQAGKPECWRQFVFLEDKNKEKWYWAKQIVEAEIQDLGNVADIFESITELFPTV